MKHTISILNQNYESKQQSEFFGVINYKNNALSRL